MNQKRLLCFLLAMGRRVWLAALWPLTLGISSTATLAAEGNGMAEDPPGVEIESEFYAGRRDYLHGGMHVHAPLNERQEIGINSHFVREQTGEPVFPSLGASFNQDLGGGVGLEAYSFTYMPVDDQHAWAVGLRGSRRLSLGDEAAITPFLGPVYANVQAIDEATERPTDIDHVMLLGGFTFETGKLEFTVLGSHSFFSRNPVGLETHVDLQEMTQFDAYENNDGFARNSLASEFSYSLTNSITLTTRYALIFFDEGTRNSIAFMPSIKLGPHWEGFAGAQLLRGDGPDQDLVAGGLSFSY
jgi:hypothetical protein